MSQRRNVLTIGAIAWLSVVACGGRVEVTPAGEGVLALVHEYVIPPPGTPVSFGGYATKATVRSVGDTQSIWSSELDGDDAVLQTLAPGDYELDVTVQPESDAILVDQNGVMHRDLGPVSARCNATVSITSGERTSVLVTTVGGDLCTIASGP